MKKNKFPTVRPIPVKQGRVRGSKTIFKVGLTQCNFVIVISVQLYVSCISVALLIPSLLQYPDQELADVQRELDITAEQSVIWPPINAASSVQEKYLPHIMWNIVNTIK